MRVRDRSSISLFIPEYRSFSGPNAVPIIVYGAPRAHGTVARMTDNPTKGFRRISGQGGIVNTPMSVKTSVLTKSPANFKQYSLANPNVPQYVTDEWTNDCPTVIGEFEIGHPSAIGLKERCDALATEAVTEAYAQIGRADVESLVSIIELPETVAFMKAPIDKGIRLVRRFKNWQAYRERTTKRHAMRMAKWESLPPRLQAKRERPVAPEIRPFRVGKLGATDISGAWLAFRYGLMPIVYEIQAVHTALTKKAEAPARVTARGRASGEWQRHYVASSSKTTYMDREHTVELDATIVARAGVLYVPREETFVSQWGLELHRVPAALYEGIPLSFVTDWFHSAATYYDAITSHMRLNRELTAWCSVSVTFQVKERNTQTPKGGLRTEGGHKGGITSSERGVIKYRYPVSVGDTRPQVRVKLNAKRIADGLALIHQFLSRRN